MYNPCWDVSRACRRSQRLRVKRFLEIGGQRCHTSSSRSTSRSTSRGRGWSSTNTCKEEATIPQGSSYSNEDSSVDLLAVAPPPTDSHIATFADTPGGLASAEAADSPFVVNTPEGPFSPFDVAAALLRGAIGRFEETCGYTSHLVQIAQLLMEQKDAARGGVSRFPFSSCYPAAAFGTRLSKRLTADGVCAVKWIRCCACRCRTQIFLLSGSPSWTPSWLSIDSFLSVE